MLTISVLRNIISKHLLTDVLALRESISLQVKTEVARAAAEWGVKIEQVEIKDIGLPVELQKAMAAEAEGRRIAKANIIASEGEVKTAEYLQEASKMIMQNPQIMLLRYLQTLNAVAAQQSTSIFFPFPLQIPDVIFNQNLH
ncbi:stomatin-2-like [Cydia strobilella]|uniref:stomatin-2-like n=1 Tax=Cydia strobilella TaxID=1100964 RepID=UPI003007D453